MKCKSGWTSISHSTANSWIDLTCHPSTPTEAVRAIRVLVRRSAGDELHITYSVDGDISQIQIPSPTTPRIGTELWRHTCFEAFIALDSQSAYHEFNFAPSREWCVYAMSSYRSGRLLADETMNPQIALRSTDNHLELDAVVRLDTLSAIHLRAVLRLGLSAVIEETGGFTYWALRHPSPKPDFHNAASFALSLDPLSR